MRNAAPTAAVSPQEAHNDMESQQCQQHTPSLPPSEHPGDNLAAALTSSTIMDLDTALNQVFMPGVHCAAALAASKQFSGVACDGQPSFDLTSKRTCVGGFKEAAELPVDVVIDSMLLHHSDSAQGSQPSPLTSQPHSAAEIVYQGAHDGMDFHNVGGHDDVGNNDTMLPATPAPNHSSVESQQEGAATSVSNMHQGTREFLGRLDVLAEIAARSGGTTDDVIPPASASGTFQSQVYAEQFTAVMQQQQQLPAATLEDGELAQLQQLQMHMQQDPTLCQKMLQNWLGAAVMSDTNDMQSSSQSHSSLSAAAAAATAALVSGMVGAQPGVLNNTAATLMSVQSMPMQRMGSGTGSADSMMSLNDHCHMMRSLSDPGDSSALAATATTNASLLASVAALPLCNSRQLGMTMRLRASAAAATAGGGLLAPGLSLMSKSKGGAAGAAVGAQGSNHPAANVAPGVMVPPQDESDAGWLPGTLCNSDDNSGSVTDIRNFEEFEDGYDEIDTLLSKPENPFDLQGLVLTGASDNMPAEDMKAITAATAGSVGGVGHGLFNQLRNQLWPGAGVCIESLGGIFDL